MPYPRLYTASEYRAIKAARSRAWRLRNRGRASQCTSLMRWYGALSHRSQLRIVLRALGLSADEMLDYIVYLRNKVSGDLTGATSHSRLHCNEGK